MSNTRKTLEEVAIEYYDRGVPSALPNGNPYKAYVENHRWGYHGVGTAGFNRNCPVCVRPIAPENPAVEDSSDNRAYRMFTAVMEDVQDHGDYADRHHAIGAIDAIMCAQFNDRQTRALVHSIARSILSGEVNSDDMQEYTQIMAYLTEH